MLDRIDGGGGGGMTSGWSMAHGAGCWTGVMGGGGGMTSGWSMEHGAGVGQE